LYLQSACASEGFPIEIDILSQLYQGAPLNSLPLTPLIPANASHSPDLRRTIHQLQLQCSTYNISVPSLEILLPTTDFLDSTFHQGWNILRDHQTTKLENHENSELLPTEGNIGIRHPAVNHADLFSYVDGYLTHHGLDMSEVSD
jgi:hypothetical protein